MLQKTILFITISKNCILHHYFQKFKGYKSDTLNRKKDTNGVHSTYTLTSIYYSLSFHPYPF